MEPSHDQESSYNPYSGPAQYRNPPKDRSYQGTFETKFKPFDTIPYIIIVIALKYAFNKLTLIQTLEFIFLLSTFYIAIILPYVSFFKKDYILGITNKDAGLSAAYWLALYLMVDFLCLKALPLLTKCSIMAFILCELDFGYIEIAQASHINRPVFMMRKNFREKRLQFIIGLVVTLIAVTIDIFIVNLFQQDIYTIISYFLVVLVLIANTLFVLMYKVKTMVYAQLERESELIKVKWLAHLMLAFFSPILVFLFNQTSNYNILRFSGNAVVISLVAMAAAMHFILTTFKDNKKIDINHSNLRRVNTSYAVIIVAGFSYIFLNTQDAWIISQ